MAAAQNKKSADASAPVVAFVETLPGEEAYLAGKLRGAEQYFFEGTLSQAPLAELAERVTVLSPFIYSQIAAKQLAQFPNLRLIATRSTGYDHIDLRAAAAAGVLVTRVPNYGEHTVAEHTIMLLLAISRKLRPSLERVKEGSFSLEGLQGGELHGKTIGIIGVGAIGSHVVRIARGLGMRVLANQRHPDQPLAAELDFSFVPLEELYAESDVISLHAPETPQTKHLINRQAIRQMKNGVIIINTARGSLISSADLLAALDSGKVAAAGIDVLEEEGLIKEERQLLSRHYDRGQLERALSGHMLLAHPNVLVTPHNAFNSAEAMQRVLSTTVGNIESFLSGSPENLVSEAS